VRSQPHREVRAAFHLEHQRFRVFLPLYRKTVRHARQFRTSTAAFFPGYLFVALAIGRDRWRSVNGTFGVSCMIMDGDLPKPVPMNVVEDLMALADPTGLVSLEPRLRPGDTVRIVTGPFAGHVGKLAALDDDGRVRVLLSLMGTEITATGRRVGLVVPAD
jgi:transcriptional antiterminator RfaH